MNKISIISSVENGNLKRNRTLIREAIESFEGKTINLTIEKHRKKRSNNQNAYLWGVLYPIAQKAIKAEWGEIHSMEAVHEFFKLRFNYTEKVNEDTGEVVHFPKSTTENTTTDQEEYHEEIRRFLSDWFGVTAPLPGEDLRLELK